MPKSPVETHMFWAYGPLSNLEKIAVNSFVSHGYRLTMWTYGDVANAPHGLTVKDARDVLPETEFFRLANGSCAPFSDYFRYAVLSKIGGLWVDTDVIALKPLTETQPFLVTERHSDRTLKDLAKETLFGDAVFSINNNVIFNPRPERGNLIDLAYAYSERFPKARVRWSELGGPLLAALKNLDPDHGFKIMKPEFANPIGYWSCPAALLNLGGRVHGSAVFVHTYNQTWREANIDKNRSFPKGSLMWSFAEQYL